LDLRRRTYQDAKKIHNEKLYDLYSSPIIVRIISLGKIICSDLMASIEEKN
jgi:hypothetical protein